MVFPRATHRADAGDVPAAEEAEVEEREEEQADAHVSELQSRRRFFVGRILRVFRAGGSAGEAREPRLDEHPGDEGTDVDGVEERLVRKREKDKDRSEGGEDDAQSLQERLASRAAVDERDGRSRR